MTPRLTRFLSLPSPSIDRLSSFGIFYLHATRPVTLRSILSILYLSINGIIQRTGIRNQKPSIPSILHPPINGTILQKELQTIGNRLASVVSPPPHRKPASECYIAAASSETGWRELYRCRGLKKKRMADHHMRGSQGGQSPKNILQQILDKIQE